MKKENRGKLKLDNTWVGPYILSLEKDLYRWNHSVIHLAIIC